MLVKLLSIPTKKRVLFRSIYLILFSIFLKKLCPGEAAFSKLFFLFFVKELLPGDRVILLYIFQIKIPVSPISLIISSYLWLFD